MKFLYTVGTFNETLQVGALVVSIGSGKNICIRLRQKDEILCLHCKISLRHYYNWKNVKKKICLSRLSLMSHECT
jgi:hypothetical protein